MTGRREIERRLSELETEDGDGDLEIEWRDTVVRTPWSNGRDDAPKEGTTVTRYYRDEDGNGRTELLERPDGESE